MTDSSLQCSGGHRRCSFPRTGRVEELEADLRGCGLIGDTVEIESKRVSKYTKDGSNPQKYAVKWLTLLYGA